MKFSTRVDSDMPADQLFAAVTDFDALERLMVGRGASVRRLKPSDEPGVTMGWRIGFDWRGKPREMRLAVIRFDRPEQIALSGLSDALELSVNATVVALSRTKSRLIFETEIRPRSMKARLMMQTAKLGKSQLDRRYARRVIDFIQQMSAARS